MAQESWNLEQEDSPCPPPTPPESSSLCSNNCGFFGSSSTMNLCSVCYRNLILLKSKTSSLLFTSPSAAASSSVAAKLSNILLHESESAPVLSTTVSSQTNSLNPIGSPMRCSACRKRLGITAFKCRCGDVFCALHRYSDKHNCTFDYKAAGRVSISKANPVVKADKLQRI